MFSLFIYIQLMLEYSEFYVYTNASRFRYKSAFYCLFRTCQINISDKYHARNKNVCENSLIY